MISFLVKPPRIFLALECATLFFITPLVLYMNPTGLTVHLTMWCVAAYAAFILSREPDFSWKQAWSGTPWTSREFKLVAARFVLASVGIALLTYLIQPDRLFSFPSQRPFFWLIVMSLYPLLSAFPQELVFRTFFFRRYSELFPQNWVMLAISACIFGFIHIVFHNEIAPLLSVLGGFFLASSYARHASLKKAAIEHALYGDMLFTVGLGYYFLVH